MIIKRKTRLLRLCLLGLCLAVACVSDDDDDDKKPDSDSQVGTAAPVAPEAQPARADGTPPGGLKEWVAEIRAALIEVQAKLPKDTQAARQVAVDFYVNRQEWLEYYYGRYGKLTGDSSSSLPDAVMDAEARYHELIMMLSADAPSRSAVDSVINALNAEYDRVLSEEARSPVPPIPNAPAGARVPATTTSTQG
jgi:hypothetical protein